MEFEVWIKHYRRFYAKCNCGESTRPLSELVSAWSKGTYPKDAAFYDAQTKKKELD